MSRFEFEIPSVNMTKFRSMMDKISKKSVKLGFDEIEFMITDFYNEEKRGKIYKIYIDTPTFKIDGWNFVATIDHTHETGNLIRRLPNEIVPEAFRTAAPICQHCNINRYRRNTYVLRSDDGDITQVGKTCLNDFIRGHDATKLAHLAETIAQMRESIAGLYETEGSGVAMLFLERYLQYTAVCIRKYGWISRKVSRENPGTPSSADMALHDYFADAQDITQADIDVADKALEWARGLVAKQDKSDYEHNVSVIAEAELIEFRSAGIAASIVGVYVRNQEKLANESVDKLTSEHVGKLGEKITVKVKSIMHKHLDTGSILWKFKDEEGNIFTWFASTYNGPEDGVLTSLTGTVKKHDVFNGVKSTLLTRCKFKEV